MLLIKWRMSTGDARSGLVRFCRIRASGGIADMRTLVCLALLPIVAPVFASDNSNSSLEVFALLEQAESAPISDTPPPPINLRSKPPTLAALQAQLAADQLLVLNYVQSLQQAQLQLSFWQAQPP